MIFLIVELASALPPEQTFYRDRLLERAARRSLIRGLIRLDLPHEIDRGKKAVVSRGGEGGWKTSKREREKIGLGVWYIPVPSRRFIAHATNGRISDCP